MSNTAPLASPPHPVAARPAATLLVVRDGADGTEVLMGRRHANHRFMPNSLVFPGGAVDEEDHHGEIATPFPPHVTRALIRHADARLAHALGVALARELFEETGLTLGNPPALDGVDFLCRAITPAIRPKRFDAFFFVVSAARVHGTPTASDELEELRFIPFVEALAVDLELATRGALERLRTWLALDAAARCERAGIPVMREKAWREE